MSLHMLDLDVLISVLLLIVYGLFCLRQVNTQLHEVSLFACIALVLYGTCLIGPSDGLFSNLVDSLLSIEGFLALLVIVVLLQVRSLEAKVLLVLTYVAQVYMIHSIDVLTFYVTLELQNFIFIILAGLPRVKVSAQYAIESSLKFLVLSAFSSGIFLYTASRVYQMTGISSLSFAEMGNNLVLDHVSYESLILLAVAMFKLGAAPVHLWVVQVYGSLERYLLFYISTAPKVAMFGFLLTTFQGVWSTYSLVLFAIVSTILGSIGAYVQPKIRMLLAYSTLSEIGLLLSAVESAGFTHLYQHLLVYLVAQTLLWNLNSTPLLTVTSVSLSGLPPLAGFFGKAWIFWNLGTTNAYIILFVSLVFTVLSLVYYLRVLRVFVYQDSHNTSTQVFSHSSKNISVMLTSFCMVLLILLPLFIVKPIFI